LREAVGALARRGEWASAAEGSLALAASLLKRGRPRDAKTVIDQARESCRNSPGDRLMIAAATLSGVALVDLGRLDEAETVLSAAQTVAAHADDRTSLAPVAVALARCRFWRGQFADARDALRLVLDAALDDVQRTRAETMRSRIAVAEGDIAAAVELAAAATERAGGMASPGLRAEASCAAAFAHLAAGDLAAVRRDVGACSAAARAARDPLRQLRGDLLLCEALRRGGRREEALKAFARARRLPSSMLPKVLKCRRDMLAEMLSAEPGAGPDIVSRHVSSSGLRTLALFAPAVLR